MAAYDAYESGRSELAELPGDGPGDEDDESGASGLMVAGSDDGGEPAEAAVATRDGGHVFSISPG